MKLTKKFAVSTSIAALFMAASSAQAMTITNLANGGTISAFAVPNTTTYGQIFVVPDAVNTKLNSFTFWMQGTLSQAFAGVATWTGTGAGVALWQSPTFAASAATMTAFTANTGGLNLVAGQQYVAYFSNGIVGNSGSNSWATGTSTTGFTWDNNSGGSPNSHIWNGCLGTCGLSAQYTMQFGPAVAVSEPETYGMMVAGLGLLGFATRRRKQALDLV